MAEVKHNAKTAESGGIRNVAPTPVLADKVPEPGAAPPEPTIKIAGLEKLDLRPKTALEAPGDTVVEDYKPTDEDLANLARKTTTVPGFQPMPDPPPERMTLIPPSIASRTMAEMKRGKEITDAKAAQRRMLMGE